MRDFIISGDNVLTNFFPSMMVNFQLIGDDVQDIENYVFLNLVLHS